MKRIQGQAFARAGLLGNPGDGYEGKAIACVIRNFSARVTLEEADRFEIVRGASEQLSAASFSEMAERLKLNGCYDGVRLLRASIKRFGDRFPALLSTPNDARQRFRISYETDIPRQVGLSGSSAIIIAALRAMMKWFEVEIPPHELAEIALAAELEDLGIQAGPMDRVIQSYEGVMLMDFKLPRTAASYSRIDPGLLPPLFVAYDPRVGEVSGKVHSDVKFRWLRGDTDVREAIAIFPKLVDEGIECLRRGDLGRFRELMDKNFDTRASIWKLSARDHEMVRIGRERGAAVKFCGSGGAVVGAMEDERRYPEIERAYVAAGYKAIRPQLVA